MEIPLWNFSNMGGTILRTLDKTSLVALEIIGLSDITFDGLTRREIVLEQRRV